jgi:hypothetical protein
MDEHDAAITVEQNRNASKADRIVGRSTAAEDTTWL